MRKIDRWVLLTVSLAGAGALWGGEARAWNGSDEAVIQSVPAGASVYLDDKLVGTTPLRLPVPCNEVVDRKYRIEYHDCRPVEGIIYSRVAPGRVVGMIFTLGITAIFQCPKYFVPVAVGMTGGSCSPSAPAASAPAGSDLERRLTVLKDLRERGVITEEEYQRERQAALNGL